MTREARRLGGGFAAGQSSSERSLAFRYSSRSKDITSYNNFEAVFSACLRDTEMIYVGINDSERMAYLANPRSPAAERAVRVLGLSPITISVGRFKEIRGYCSPSYSALVRQNLEAATFEAAQEAQGMIATKMAGEAIEIMPDAISSGKMFTDFNSIYSFLGKKGFGQDAAYQIALDYSRILESIGSS